MATLRLALLLLIVLAACTPEAPSASARGAGESPPATAAPLLEPSSPKPSASTVAVPSESRDPIGDVQCAGGATSGSSDYAAGTGGGLPDIEQATRALYGVLPSDDVVVETERSAVRRDGRVIFIGWWSKSSAGGWLLSTFVNCSDSGIGFD
jgi:hypothetical protein